MAYTRIHAIKSTLNKSVAYICNPAKTEDELLISSFACSPDTAHKEFMYALGENTKKGDNLAYHLIQSFSPEDNVSPAEAHKIGQALADEVLEGKYSYVLTTHTEKNHLHNHIIFCATDNIDHKKYNDCKRSYHKIRQISDRLCDEYNLSVIKPGKQQGKSHYEWQMDKEGKSYKTWLRKEIDSAIRSCGNYENFIAIIKSKGIEVKGDNLGEEQLKYISFKPYSAQRFTRGSARSLGEDYTRERIMERIAERQLSRTKMPSKPLKNNQLIDTSTEKMMENYGLRNWGQKKNIKLITSLYAKHGSIEELREKLATQKTIKKNAHESILKADKDLRILPEAIKYADFYEKYKSVYDEFMASENKEAFNQLHETELQFFYGAEKYLEAQGFDTKTVSKKVLTKQYKVLQSKKEEWKKAEASVDAEIADLQQELTTLEKFFGQDTSQEQSTEKKKEEQSI